MINHYLDTLDPEFRALIAALLAELRMRGIICVPTSAYRTPEEQDKLYAQGRTTSGRIVTKAKGTPVPESPHCYRLAVDICPVHPVTGKLWWDAPDDVWQVIHRLAEERGYLDSGYDWKFCDRPHIESPDWKREKTAYMAGLKHNG